MDMDQDIPYAVGAIMTVPGMPGQMIVAQQSYENCGEQPSNYTLRGHPDLGTGPGSSAWHTHRNLRQVEAPSGRSWALLKEAVRLDQQSRVAKPGR
jgi:hypothetical protein